MPHILRSPKLRRKQNSSLSIIFVLILSVFLFQQNSYSQPVLPLSADVNFNVQNLSPEMQEWHAKMVAAVEAGRSLYQARCGSNDLYLLGRFIATRSISLIWALRATGDPFFLHEVVKCWEIARADLDDSWCGEPDDDDVNSLNWVYKGQGDTGSSHYCRDTHNMDEAMTHGFVGLLALTLDKNRHIESIDQESYAAKADFWLDYLVNHFLPKWVRRAGDPIAAWESTSGAYKRLMHPRLRQLMLARTLEELSADPFYTERAAVVEDNVIDRLVYNSGFDSYQWKHELWLYEGEESYGWQKLNYADYVLTDMLNLYVDQKGFFRSETEMNHLMHTVKDAALTKFGPPYSNMAQRIDGSGSTGFDFGTLSSYARFDGTGALLNLADQKYAELMDGSPTYGSAMKIAGGILLALSEREGAGIPQPTPTPIPTPDPGGNGSTPDPDTPHDPEAECPADAKKEKAGICGCEKYDSDYDSDGTVDCIEQDLPKITRKRKPRNPKIETFEGGKLITLEPFSEAVRYFALVKGKIDTDARKKRFKQKYKDKDNAFISELPCGTYRVRSKVFKEKTTRRGRVKLIKSRTGKSKKITIANCS